MYLFIMFQLCRIYNEKKLKKTNHPILSVFLFLSVQLTKMLFGIPSALSALFLIVNTNRNKCVVKFSLHTHQDAQSCVKVKDGSKEVHLAI